MLAGSPFDKLMIAASYLHESGGGGQSSDRTLTREGMHVRGKTTSRVDVLADTIDASLTGAMRKTLQSGALEMLDQYLEHTQEHHSQRLISIALPHIGAEAGQQQTRQDTLSIHHTMGPVDPRKGLATLIVTKNPGGQVGGDGSYTHVAMLDIVNGSHQHYTQRHFVASFIKLAKLAVQSKIELEAGGSAAAALDMVEFDTVKINPSMSFYWGVVSAASKRSAFGTKKAGQSRFNVGMMVRTLRHLPQVRFLHGG